MAVVAVWKSDRDGTMFENKKDAEEHDRMLDLAKNITELLDRNISGLNSELSVQVGLLLAKHRDDLAKACKGKPELLQAIRAEEADSSHEDDDKVAVLASGQ